MIVKKFGYVCGKKLLYLILGYFEKSILAVNGLNLIRFEIMDCSVQFLKYLFSYF